ncbi:MAG: SDR family oxidoreductase [Proteobacteria bacterium]|nr:SDR family oxidoreductase [Pseudomonadota bacterium]HQR04406.1 SDR family oxidoreductase [Rhodocyclaceae bacterium]
MSVKKLFDLDGKVALVTGGSRGLGLQMAEALGEMGARIAITARKQDELEKAAARLRDQGIEVLTLPCDLGQASTADSVVDAVVGAFGGVDILVNNAGATWGAPAEEHSLEAWDKVMNLNVRGLFLLSQSVGRKCMIPRRSGKIINIASIAGLFGNPPAWDMQTLAYNTSKGAVVNFTRTLATEWGCHGINVNAICPGFFPSKMTQGLLSRIDRQVLESTPLGRVGGEEDLKGAVVYLASEASRFVTGQMLVVDGGMSCY